MGKNNWLIWIVYIFVFLVSLYYAFAFTSNAFISYELDSVEMTEGCSGDIELAPTVAYDLEVCLENGSGIIISESCKTYTSGTYDGGDTIQTNATDLIVGEQYRLSITWKRIRDNAGRYDHGESVAGSHTETCAVRDANSRYFAFVGAGCTDKHTGGNAVKESWNNISHIHT